VSTKVIGKVQSPIAHLSLNTNISDPVIWRIRLINVLLWCKWCPIMGTIYIVATAIAFWQY
jgi:hypothetical protein